MPGPIDLGGNASADFAASLVAAVNASGEDANGDPEGTTTDGVDAGESDEAADDAGDVEGADADGSDDAGDDDEPAEDDGADGEVPDLSAVGQLFVDGDLAAACKALGIDPKVLNVSEPKFKAMRQGLKEARETKAAGETALAEAAGQKTKNDAILKDAKAKYGPLVDLKNALGLGDYGAAKELLESLAPKGVTFQQIAEGIVQAARGVSPGEMAARRELKRIKEEREAEQTALAAKETEKQTEAQKTALAEKNLKGAETRLKGTQFDGVDGAAAKLVEIVAANWDYDRKGPKLTPDGYLKLLGEDPVIKQLVELKVLKKGKTVPTARKGSKDRLNREQPATETRDNKGQFVKRVGPKVTKEDEFKASIAEAARQEAAELRTRRRTKR